MSQRSGDNDSNSIEFTGPGVAAKLKGNAWTSNQTIVVMLIIASTAFLSWERDQANRTFLAQHANTQALLAKIIDSQTAMVKELRAVSEEVSAGNEVQTYVLSLSQDKRERLNLSMPASLRSRIRSNTQ